MESDCARYQLIARATYLPKGNLVAAATYLADSVALKRKRAGIFAGSGTREGSHGESPQLLNYGERGGECLMMNDEF